MICLCCGKSLGKGIVQNGWHQSCIKKFFGTKELPEIEIDEQTLEQLATENTNKGI